jgi:hypothetical protein
MGYMGFVPTFLKEVWGSTIKFDLIFANWDM